MFVLAGAAGGATKRPEWRKVLVDHIETARSIDHPIDRLIILEHRDCGAYKAFFDVDWEKITPPEEEAAHVKQATASGPGRSARSCDSRALRTGS